MADPFGHRRPLRPGQVRLAPIIVGDGPEHAALASIGGLHPKLGRQHLAADGAHVIDVGGDDTYRIPVAANQNVANLVSIAIDLGGDDVYGYVGDENAQAAAPLLPDDNLTSGRCSRAVCKSSGRKDPAPKVDMIGMMMI